MNYGQQTICVHLCTQINILVVVSTAIKTDVSLSVTSHYSDISFGDISEIILQIIKRLTKIIIISSMLSPLFWVLFVIAKLLSGQIYTLLVTTWMQTDLITNRNK